MIINALYTHYQTLAKRPGSDIPKEGFARLPVAFVFNLAHTGDLLDVIPLGDKKGKRWIPVELEVPEPPKRSGTGVTPCFLCDNSMYIIGNDTKGKPERSRRAFESSRILHLEVLRDVDDEGAHAVCRYFERWDPDIAVDHPALRELWDDVLSGGNIVFRLDGSTGYIHERPAIRKAWLKYRARSTSDATGQCLVTGEVAPIARIHPSIKGVRGAQTAGAALVSFNLNAFTSYGKTQNFNAPVSEAVAFGYTTVLNYLLSSPRNRLQLDANTTAVFWSERPDGTREEDLMAQLLDFGDADDTSAESGIRQGSAADFSTIELVRDVLERVRRGMPIDFDAIKVDANSRFFILGLSPNSSRISVRFWQVDTFGNMVHRVAQHHTDLAIVPPSYAKNPYISVRAILRETAPLGDWERIPPLLAGGLMRSILTGLPYPQGLYTTLISRIRADRDVNYVRAAVIKAILTRNSRFQVLSGQSNDFDRSQEVKITMSLDEQNTNPGYRLGRLFAVLEKVQQEANPGLNATIRDRYFGAASATPRAVFPQLLRLAQHHVSKATYGGISDKLIETIVSELDDFPTHLNLKDQGLFMLGYYHQRQAFYQKSDSKE